MLKGSSGGGGGGGQPRQTYCICVIGMSAKGGPDEAEGVGKSCLCNRFVRPSQDDFRLKHISVVSEADFAGQVLRGTHWLYWGGVERRPGGALYHVVEQTEFVNDKDLRPFAAAEPYYARCAVTKLHAAQKLAWVCSDQLGFENEYPRQRAPDGSLLIGGFLVCFEMSSARSFERQVRFLQEVAPLLHKTKRPALLVATKVDQAFAQLSGDAYARQLDALRKECKHHRCFAASGHLVAETSAALNINVEEAFRCLAALIDRDGKGRVAKPAPFGEAFAAWRAQSDAVVRDFHQLLQRTVRREMLFLSFQAWQASHATSQEFLHLIDLLGTNRARDEFHKHLSGLRRDAIAERRRAICKTLRRYLERAVPDCASASRLADMAWSEAAALIAAALDPADRDCYLVGAGRLEASAAAPALVWHDSAEYLNSPDTRVPMAFLVDEIEARPVFEAHTDRLMSLRRTVELRQRLAATLRGEAGAGLRWGMPMEEAARLVPRWPELVAELEPADVRNAYADFQASLQRRCLAELNEALMELAGQFYRPHTGRDSTEAQKELAWQALARDPRHAGLLEQRHRLGDALGRHLQFVRGGGGSVGCFYDRHCVERLVPDALNNCLAAAATSAAAAAAASWASSSSSLSGAVAAPPSTEVAAESPLLLLGPERLSKLFKRACRSLCQTQDTFAMTGRLYRLSFRSPRLSSPAASGARRHEFIGCVMLYDCAAALAALQGLAVSAPLLLEAQQALLAGFRDASTTLDEPVEDEYEYLVPSSASSSRDTSSSELASPPLPASSHSPSPTPIAAGVADFRIVVAFAAPAAAADDIGCGGVAELRAAGLRLAGRLNALFVEHVEGEEADSAGLCRSGMSKSSSSSLASAAASAAVATSDSAALARRSLEHLLPASFYRRTPDMLYLHRDACQLQLICSIACGDPRPTRDRLSGLVASLAGGRASVSGYRGHSLAVELHPSRRVLVRLAAFHSAWHLCDSHAFHGALVAFAADRRASFACAETLVGNIAHRMPVALIAMGTGPFLDSGRAMQSDRVRCFQLDASDAAATSAGWFSDFVGECLAAKELTERQFQARFPTFVHRDRSPPPPAPLPGSVLLPELPAARSAADPPSPIAAAAVSAASITAPSDEDDPHGDDDSSVYSSGGGTDPDCGGIYSCPGAFPVTPRSCGSVRPPLASQEICEVYADPPDAPMLLHQRGGSGDGAGSQWQRPSHADIYRSSSKSDGSSSVVCGDSDSTYADTCNALPAGTYRMVASRSDYSTSTSAAGQCHYASAAISLHPPPPPPPPPSPAPFGRLFSSLSGKHRSGGSGQSQKAAASGWYLAVPAPPLRLTDLPTCPDQHRVDGPVPQLVVTCVEFVERSGGLHSEGIYRLCGNASETSAVADLLLREPACDLAALKPRPTVCTVTSALKQLLVKLEPSLIPSQLLGGLLKLASVPHHYPHFQPHVAHFFANNLSQPSLACLRYLMRHLNRVGAHCAENRMPPANLAVCWIQTLMPAGDPRAGLACQELLQSLVETLIRYPHLLLPPPQQPSARLP